MRSIRDILEQRLKEMPGVTVGPWKDTDLIDIQFQGKSIAHFHGDTVLDIRLSTKRIKALGLTRKVSQRVHPERTLKSRWICVEFLTEAQLDEVVGLVALACAERQT